MKLKKAYKKVVKDILKNGPDLFKGCYAPHDAEDEDAYMQGISEFLRYLALKGDAMQLLVDTFEVDTRKDSISSMPTFSITENTDGDVIINEDTLYNRRAIDMCRTCMYNHLNNCPCDYYFNECPKINYSYFNEIDNPFAK